MGERERFDYERRYAEVAKASKFVLCPRGLSVSSIRLFETMRMGRVPVILSDAWIAPPGPRWEMCAIRVREKDFAKVPRLLEQREPEAVKMGELARKEWEEWFSDEVLFHRLVELCLDIRANRKWPESVTRWPVYLQRLRPFISGECLVHRFAHSGMPSCEGRNRVGGANASALANRRPLVLRTAFRQQSNDAFLNVGDT